MSNQYYIASCVFTRQFPEVSQFIQQYIKEHFGMPIVRCCIPNYHIKAFEDAMKPGYLDSWKALPDCADFQPGDIVYSLCHNCSNIIEETKPGVQLVSLWELILQDKSFSYPDFHGMKVTVQDCWRSREREAEQEAVRSILTKMNIRFVEAPQNHGQTEFCGSSLYREQPARNPKLAPKHYKEQAIDKFEPHSPEEQIALMKQYSSQFTTDTVVCYCHYCLEGLLQGGVDGRHLAHMLFQKIKIFEEELV